MKHLILALSIFLSGNLFGQDITSFSISEDLEVLQLSEHIYIHKSYATVEPYGRFYSNGMIYAVDGNCFVFDTPMSKAMSSLLLKWIEEELQLKVKGIIVNHFHEDCLGGLEVFHQAGIPSYSGIMTQHLALEDSSAIPMYGFKRKRTLRLSREKLILYYPGEAHSKDNTVAWIPGEKVLFGGCMVKSLKSGKGNLADANVAAWPLTIKKVKKKFADATWVIPGHGKAGGLELLDYTLQLFTDNP